MNPRLKATIAMAAFLSAAGAAPLVLAQAKKGAPAQPKTFTIDFSEGTANGLPVTIQATLREQRVGAAVKQTEIEVCFASSAVARRIDRFSTVLTQNGGVWRGTATTNLDKTPVEITLQRSGKPNELNFTGEIKAGAATIQFAQSEVSFIEEESPPDTTADIEVGTPDQPDISVNTVSLVLKPAAIPGVVPLLRKYKAEVKTEYLVANCDSLRTDTHNIVAVVTPERAQALVNEAKAVSGVAKAGWAGGSTVIGDTVRIPAGAFLAADGAVARDKIFEALTPAIARALGQSATKKPEISETTGIATLYFAGASTTLRGVGLKDATEVNLLISREALNSNSHIVISIDDIDRSIEDESSGLTVIENKSGEEGGESDTGVRRALHAAIAQALGGETWDEDKRAWVKP